MTNRLSNVSALTIQRVTAALVILIVGFWFLAGIWLFEFSSLYLVFIIVTILVVRSVPVQPGAWLGRQPLRRGLVGVIAMTLVILSLSPYGPNGVGAVPLLSMILALSFILLGRATKRVASAPDEIVDEREEALRNRAHRIAYVIFAILAAATILVSYMATADSRDWLDRSLKFGAPFITFFLLLFFLPAMVLAWLEPDRSPADLAPRLPLTGRARLAISMVAIALLLPIALTLALPFAPLRTTMKIVAEPYQTSAMSCKYFEARTRAGLGFGGVIPLSAEACWDGQKAFENWGLNQSDCHAFGNEGTIADTVACSRTTDAEGTLHFLYKVRLRSTILPFIVKEVTMRLSLARDGHVLLFP
jgi:hypothetical protein